MLKELKFVQGSVAKKDFLPALTHFVCENGTIRGFNGTLALCSPIPFDIACKPKADPMVRAIGMCQETVTLALSAAGRLRIQSGAFKAFVDCVEGPTAHVEPEGDHTDIDGAALLAAIKAVHPFVGDDASRPWTNGVLFKGQSAFATNNVSLVEYWIGNDFPTTISIPRAAVKEILRIGEPPTSAQMNERSLTLHYSGDRWIRTQLLSTDWPDLKPILDRASVQAPVDQRLFEGLAVLRPFVDKMGRIFFQNGGMFTHEHEGEGASYMLDDFAIDGVYNVDILGLLESIATTIDFSTYPKPCVFYGEKLRGALIGMRRLEPAK